MTVFRVSCSFNLCVCVDYVLVLVRVLVTAFVLVISDVVFCGFYPPF